MVICESRDGGVVTHTEVLLAYVQPIASSTMPSNLPLQGGIALTTQFAAAMVDFGAVSMRVEPEAGQNSAGQPVESHWTLTRPA